MSRCEGMSAIASLASKVVQIIPIHRPSEPPSPSKGRERKVSHWGRYPEHIAQGEKEERGTERDAERGHERSVRVRGRDEERESRVETTGASAEV